MANPAFTAHGDHVRLTVRLTPNGGRDAIDGLEAAADGEEHLKVRVSAVPEKGKANQALIAAFDPLLRRAEKANVIGITSSVGGEPRAFWGGYGASKAALETMLGAYADETEHAGRLRIQMIDPGATRTRMRQLAYPGEEPESLKPPEAVAEFVIKRLLSDAPSGTRARFEHRGKGLS